MSSDATVVRKSLSGGPEKCSGERCAECPGVDTMHHFPRLGPQALRWAKNDPRHPAALAGNVVWTTCAHCDAWSADPDLFTTMLDSGICIDCETWTPQKCTMCGAFLCALCRVFGNGRCPTGCSHSSLRRTLLSVAARARPRSQSGCVLALATGQPVSPTDAQSIEQVAKLLGRDESWVRRFVAIYDSRRPVQEYVEAYDLPAKDEAVILADACRAIAGEPNVENLLVANKRLDVDVEDSVSITDGVRVSLDEVVEASSFTQRRELIRRCLEPAMMISAMAVLLDALAARELEGCTPKWVQRAFAHGLIKGSTAEEFLDVVAGLQDFEDANG